MSMRRVTLVVSMAVTFGSVAGLGGFGGEDTIRAIWKAEAPRPTSPPAGAGE